MHLTQVPSFPLKNKILETATENDFSLNHYENMSVQYEAISKGGKNDIFRCKNMTFFLIFAQNIDCGYTLEPPQ